MTRIKICGITNSGDALAAAEAGADYLGLVFARSPRRIAPADVPSILADAPDTVQAVGVCVDEPLPSLIALRDECRLDYIQLCGSEDDDMVLALGPASVIRAFRLSSQDQIDAVGRCPAAMVLVEPYVLGMHGGTGRQLDEGLAALAIATGRPVILAGGLSPDNVHGLISRLRPYAVDVSSGVEASPGRKDRAMLVDFVNAVRDVDRGGRENV